MVNQKETETKLPIEKFWWYVLNWVFHLDGSKHILPLPTFPKLNSSSHTSPETCIFLSTALSMPLKLLR